MELTDIIAELENNTGKFPRQAVERAIEEKEAITPVLLENLEKWKDNLEELVELPNYFLHIYAMYLLAQFNEPKAYPLIIEFFSTPGEITLDVTGDLVTEDLARILANVSHGDIEPVKQLIENPQINEYVRSAALRSLVVLVAQGVISRELVIEYFEELFTTRLQQERSSDREPAYIWTNLVVDSAKLYPLELKEHIDQAFESELVDQFFISQKDVDYYLKLGKEATLEELRKDSHYSLIEDTIAEMEWWHCFREEEPKIKRIKPSGIGQLELVPRKTTNSKNKSKKRAQNKRQKQARRKNRSKKK